MHLSENTIVIQPPTQEPITLAEVRRFLRIDVPGYPGDTSQDEYVQSLITGARRVCEEFTDRSIGVQTLMVAAASFHHLHRYGLGYPSGYFPGYGLSGLAGYRGNYNDWLNTEGIELPYGPVRSVQSIKYLTSDGQDLTVDPTIYRLTETPPQRIILRPGNSWPNASLEPESVRVYYVAGMGPAARGTSNTEAYADNYADDYTGSVIVGTGVADRYTITEDIVVAIRLLIAHYYVNRSVIINVIRGAAPEMPFGVRAILEPNRASIGI